MTLRLILSSALVVATAQIALAAELSVATGDYPPFTDPSIESGGSVNQLVRDVAEEAGFEVSFHYLPWARSLELARAGHFAATSFWYFNEERTADFIHVGPLLSDRLVFFHLADTAIPDWNNLEELGALTIGAVTGYTLTPEFWQLSEEGGLTVELAPSDTSNLRKLSVGRIDLYPMSEESGWMLIEELFGPDGRARFATAKKPLSVTDGYLLVSRASEGAEGLAHSLTDALTSIRASEGKDTPAAVTAAD